MFIVLLTPAGLNASVWVNKCNSLIITILMPTKYLQYCKFEMYTNSPKATGAQERLEALLMSNMLLIAGI